MNEFDDLEAILSQASADVKVTVEGLHSHYDGYMNLLKEQPNDKN